MEIFVFARLQARPGKQTELRAFLHRGIREHSVTSETLVWLCKERTGEWRELITPDLLGAILKPVAQ